MDWWLGSSLRSCHTGDCSRQSGAWYTLDMPKANERWLLFQYEGRKLTPLSKPFKTKEQAEKARLRYPERERKTMGIGVIRTGS